MDKKLFEKLSNQYGPLVRWLIDSNYLYMNIDTKIQWQFAWDNDTRVTGAVNRNTNIMSINVLFVDEAYRNNRIYDIEHFLIHEMRHIYQHNQIKKYKTNSHTIDPIFINRWINEGKDYKKSLDENGNENIEYYKQDCELDAYAFSYAVMKYKYGGMYDSKLFIPNVYKNELKEEFDKAVNDFINSLKF